MPRNTYFSQGTKSEQSLYEDIVIEGLKIYGHDAYYIPRKIVNEDSIFNEDPLSSFGSSYMVEAYVPVGSGEARWVRVHHLRCSNQLKTASY